MSEDNDIDSIQECRLLFNKPIEDESAGILLRSRLMAIATRMGFVESKRQSMALSAAEMVSNQIKHAAKHGLIQIWQQPGSLDLFGLDFGLGIDDISRAQEDGYSTVNTLGKGLGTILRVPDQSGIYTRKPTANADWHGTAVWCRFTLPATPGKLPFSLGLYCRAFSDARYNGDRIYFQHRGEVLRWLHLDGLGHGEEAQLTTGNLGTYVNHGQPLSEVLRTLNQRLTRTRGAVGMVSEVSYKEGRLNILGVGDMSAHLYDGEQFENFSFAPGILGHEHKTPTLISAIVKRKSTIFTASDGIRRGWDHTTFPALLNHHPQLIAYVLGNIKGRVSDDQSLCVVRF